MPIEAFNTTNSIVGALNGGVTAVDRSLLLSRGTTQTRASQSIQDNFASRIDAAIAKLHGITSTPITDALQQDQALLTSRKERLSEAISVIDKSLSFKTLVPMNGGVIGVSAVIFSDLLVLIKSLFI